MAGAVAKRLFDQAFNDELLTEVEANPDTKAWTAAGRNRNKSNPAGEDGVWWRNNGPDMVQRWIDWRYDSGWGVWTTPEGQPAIELGLIVEYPVTSEESEQVKVIIDRVMVTYPGKQLCIVDLKSGARTPESDLQLAFYRYAILKAFGVDVRLGCYWMARKGEPTEPHDLQHFDPDLMETWFRTFRKARENGIFIPHPSAKCRACGVRKYCRAVGGSEDIAQPRGDEIERGQLQGTGVDQIRSGIGGNAQCAS